jgi:WD40 repeat protein
MGLPINCESYLQGHCKPITSISIERNGLRIATGSWDNDVRLWDFSGMDKSMNSFRILTPIEGHVINNISHNSTD